MSVKISGDQKIDPGFIGRADASGSIPATPMAELDSAVAELKAHSERWAALDLNERILILSGVLDDLHAVGEEWVAAEINAKGIRGNSYAEAEEWAIFSYGLRIVRLLRQSLQDLRGGNPPQIPGPIDTLPNGQLRARVFPVDRYDSLIFMGMTADVWLQPGISRNDLLDNQAQFYRGQGGEGKVCLVLGAGNIAVLIPTDFLTKLFVDGSVVILKMNPVNAHLGPIVARAFNVLIARNFLRIVYGGAEEGNYLCHHPDVDDLHMTGSDKTYEAIVFGPGEAGARRKAQRRPLLDKPFSAELGNISPIIIVPGPWSTKDIERWGEKLVSWLVINAGFNCTTPRLIMQWKKWQLRQVLNEAVSTTLAQTEIRKAYYPGAHERHGRFVAAHPDCQRHGPSDEEQRLPWTFITGVDAQDSDNVCFKNEAFCGLFAETALGGENVASFLETAVSFANEHLWGNLAATLVVHPSSLKDAAVGTAVEQAIADLRYGTVLVNQIGPISMFAMTTPWGAFPGNDRYDIQSGVGVTCNALMLDNTQKVVVRNPFKVTPDALGLNSRTVLDTCRQLAELQYQPSIWKMPGIFWSALRS